MPSPVRYLEGEIKLKPARGKSRVGSPRKLIFPGFPLRKVRGKPWLRPHGKSLKRFRDKARRSAKRNRAAGGAHVG
jgi:hypothetical protein